MHSMHVCTFNAFACMFNGSVYTMHSMHPIYIHATQCSRRTYAHTHSALVRAFTHIYSACVYISNMHSHNYTCTMRWHMQCIRKHAYVSKYMYICTYFSTCTSRNVYITMYSSAVCSNCILHHPSHWLYHVVLYHSLYLSTDCTSWAHSITPHTNHTANQSYCIPTTLLPTNHIAQWTPITPHQSQSAPIAILHLHNCIHSILYPDPHLHRIYSIWAMFKISALKHLFFSLSAYSVWYILQFTTTLLLPCID